MRAWIVKASGGSRNAIALVFADNETTALEQGTAVIDRSVYLPNPTFYDVQEVPTEGATVIWDGEY